MNIEGVMGTEGTTGSYLRLSRKDLSTKQGLGFLLLKDEINEINMLYGTGAVSIDETKNLVFIADPAYWELLCDGRYLIPLNFSCEMV